MQEVPASPPPLDRPVNALLDGHERQIYHSIYETTEGPHSSSTPRANMISRIGEFVILLLFWEGLQSI